MLNFLRNLFGIQKPFVHGAILDQQKAAELPQFTELVAKANPVKWEPLDLKKLPNYPVRNQNGSSGCVAFTLALMCSILYFLRTGQWIDFSPAWFYWQRRNKPGQGMIADDAFGIWGKTGAIPDEFMPSDNKTEDELNNPKLYSWLWEMAKTFLLGTKPIILPIKDIETVASVIQTTGKPVMVWFTFGSGEWLKVPKWLRWLAPYAHSVLALCPSKPGEMTFGIYEGEKAIVIQDSWGKDLQTIDGKRIIKESFFKERNYFAAYVMNFKFDEKQGSKPHYDESTASLQDCLTYEGLFPANIKNRGVYGNVTKDAVVAFQKKYSIQQTGTVGPITRAKLHELYP